MIEQISLFLATPIMKAILDNFYEGIGSKLGEKAVEVLPEKVKQLGQLVWKNCLSSQPHMVETLQKAANGSTDDQEKLFLYIRETLDANTALNQDAKIIADEIHQVISLNNTNAENIQQIFGGQGIQINEKQDQPIMQFQGNPTININTRSSD
jgi:hypothetical protein